MKKFKIVSIRKDKKNFLGLESYDDRECEFILKMRDCLVSLEFVANMLGVEVEKFKKDCGYLWDNIQQQPALAYQFVFADKIIEDWNKAVNPNTIVEKYKLQHKEHLWLVLHHYRAYLTRPIGIKPVASVKYTMPRLKYLYDPKFFFDRRTAKTKKELIFYNNRKELLADLPKLRKMMEDSEVWKQVREMKDTRQKL